MLVPMLLLIDWTVVITVLVNSFTAGAVIWTGYFIKQLEKRAEARAEASFLAASAAIKSAQATQLMVAETKVAAVTTAEATEKIHKAVNSEHDRLIRREREFAEKITGLERDIKLLLVERAKKEKPDSSVSLTDLQSDKPLPHLDPGLLPTPDKIP